MLQSEIKIKGSPNQGLFGATLGFFIGLAAVSLYGPSIHKFKEILQLSPLLLAFLISAPQLTGSLLRIPFGAWADTTGGRKPFLILLILSALGIAGLLGVIYFLYPAKLTPAHYPLLFFLGAIGGCGVATFSVGVGQVSYWFPQEKQGRALGIYAGIGNMAPGIFAFLLPIAITNWSLESAYIAWLIFSVIGIIIYALTGLNACYFQCLRNNYSKEEAKKTAQNLGQEIFPKGSVWEGVIHAGKIWKTWALVIIYFTTFGGFLALTAWLPTYWREFLGEIKLFGLLTAVYSILTSIIRVFGGFWSDKFGGEKVAIFSLFTLLLGSLTMTFAHNFKFSLIGEIIMALGMGVANAAVFKMLPKYIPEAVGGAAGWIGGIGAFGGFIIPPLMAIFVKNQGIQGYSRGFIIFIFLASVSIFLSWILKNTSAKIS